MTEPQEIQSHAPTQLAARRTVLWDIVCRNVLSGVIESTDVVVALGSDGCGFLDAIECERKVVVDPDPALRLHVAEGITAVTGDAAAVLSKIGDATIHVVFCTDALACLRSSDAVGALVGEIHRVLVPDGRLIVMQPNIRYAYREYWDVPDRRIPLSHGGLAALLERGGFRIASLRPHVLPYTLDGRVAHTPWLLRLYLALPPLQWLFGKHMLVIARKDTGEPPHLGTA